ncbi:DUF1987 domain-containing protein [bacterium AH-315-C20]|nr:DUF1987 domain-containing protein [bacterium AH-315-C20]
MEPLIIRATKLTPTVELIAEQKALRIEGECLPEDARTYFKPILEWLQEYGETHPSKMNLKIYLKYFNSSSAKQLVKIFYLLEDLSEMCPDIQITWIHKQADEMMKERGQELGQLTKIPFSIVEA